MRIIDETGSASILFFNSYVHKLCGKTAWEIMEKHGMDPDSYFPSDLEVMIGKKCLIKVFYSEFCHNNNSHTYRCDGISEDPEVISYFKREFIEDVDVHL